MPANAISFDNIARTPSVGGSGSIVKIYTGALVTPTGWTGSGGALSYVGNDVFAENTLTSLTANNGTGNLDGVFDFSGLAGSLAFDCNSCGLSALPSSGANIGALDCHNNSIGTADLTGYSNLVNAVIGPSPPTSILTLTGCTALQTLDFNNSGIQVLNATPSPSLVSLLAGVNPLNSLNVTGLTLLTNLIAPTCLLNQAALDGILAALVTNGASNGNCVLNGAGNGTPSAAGLASKAILVSRGWTVFVNP